MDAAPILVKIAEAMEKHGLEAVMSPTGLKFGYPPGPFLFMAAVATLAAVGDVRMLVRGGIFGTQRRLARHLWRMCFGLFIATGSFFLGQQQVFPAFLRGSIFLTILALLPFPLMIYWLFRVRFSKAYRAGPPAPDSIRIASNFI